MSADRELRQALGYPRRPAISANSTREGYLREFERWRREMLTALQLDLNTIEYWNRTHADQAPIDTSFESEMMEWIRAFKPLARDNPPPPEPPGATT